MDLKSYQRQRRKNQIKKRMVIIAVFFISTMFAVWVFFWIPYFWISNIETFGAENPPNIKGAILGHLTSRNSLFLPNNHYGLLSVERIEEILKDKGFGLASAEKAFPNTLIIKFKKSEPWLIFCLPVEVLPRRQAGLAKAGQSECYYIDEKGILGTRAPQFSELPLSQILLKDPAPLKLGGSVISSEDAVFLKSWFDSLKTIEAMPSEIEFSKEDEVKIILKEGWFIYLTKNSDPQKLFYDLKLLLDQKIKGSRPNLEYIDLRFENKAFYKLRD